MRLSSGAKLGAYEIAAPLGAGGMGEVYRAHDSSLKRDVAIKIISEPYSSDPERLHRFQLEAEATASLNHPNIVTIHHVGRQDGTVYIVSELLHGESLRERLRHGPLPVRVATDLGAQIARGLAAAHDHGIVHRDLKPENIFITRDGRVKILDFGLAKLVEQRAGEGSDESTVTHMTDPGTVVGTCAYMSPEQVQGRTTDFHSDIFALGAVLYEMVTGKRAFAKATAAETMTAILKEDLPPISQSGKQISPALERVVQRCLEKKPEQRFQSASDLAFALDALSDSSGSGHTAIAPARRLLWPWIAGAACALAVLGFFLWLRLPPSVPVVESITQITDDGEPKSGAFSDGSRIYFMEGEPGAIHIAQVSVSGGQTGPIANAPPNSSIVNVARDGSELLLRAENNDVLALPMPVGDPRRLLDAKSVDNVELSPDGGILFSTPVQDGKSDLMIAERDGSNPTKIKSFPSAVTGLLASPDGQRIFLCERDKDGCALQSMGKDGSDKTFVMDIRDGDVTWYTWNRNQKYIVYTRATGDRSDVWALSLRPSLLHPGRGPIRLTNSSLSYEGAFPSPDGTQIFTVGTKGRAELVRYDSKTHQFLPYLPGLSATEPHFSADGKWIAYLTFPDLSLWRSRVDGSERMQLTFPPMRAWLPRFSPDGKKIAFTISESASSYATYVVDSSGGQPRKIADGAGGAEWSPDGNSVVLTTGDGNGHALIGLTDLASGKGSVLSGSKGIEGAHFVNAKMLVAFNSDINKFVTFDFSNGKWSDLVSLPSGSRSWHVSTDRKSLLYTIGGKELQVQRVWFENHKVETITSLKDFRQATNQAFGADFGVTPDGSLIFSRDLSSQEIYALSIRWP
jgi:serine/threonine protein kinase